MLYINMLPHVHGGHTAGCHVAGLDQKCCDVSDCTRMGQLMSTTSLLGT